MKSKGGKASTAQASSQSPRRFPNTRVGQGLLDDMDRIRAIPVFGKPNGRGFENSPSRTRLTPTLGGEDGVGVKDRQVNRLPGDAQEVRTWQSLRERRLRQQDGERVHLDPGDICQEARGRSFGSWVAPAVPSNAVKNAAPPHMGSSPRPLKICSPSTASRT